MRLRRECGVGNLGWMVLALAALGGCATPRSSPPSVPVSQVPPAEVVAYPAAGQSERQSRQDRYECHLWAVQQSSYDPAMASTEPVVAPRVEADPPVGTGTVVGAVTGALIGAVVAGPGHGGPGPGHGGDLVATGAVVGALAGTAADVSRQAEADEAQARYDAQAGRANADQLRQQDAYRRAISACLDARGYRVR